jgi:homopolymeric O-antigen transport system ATP-binding protein
MASLDIVIRSEALSKSYVLGARVDRGKTFRDTLAGAATGAAARLRAGGRGTRKRQREVVWALRDVSFEVERGDVVGIIGRNGAGKSTLLKILSRVTEPSAGRAHIRGRLGSLLEVGTGFHGELTGRENVYLNGAILGMRRAEINRRFDEIVSFAEVARFLDTPVKRYSTGMLVRLAFAVAAHLETEILLVDEVLAVGDVGFQRKCIGKMSEVAGEGRTVFFVSHNMATMQALCRRGIFLEGGRVHTDGSIVEAVTGYLRSVEQAGTIDLEQRTDRRGWHEVVLSSVEITGAQHDELLATGRPARFSFRTKLREGDDSGRLSCTFVIVNHLGQAVTTLASVEHGPNDLEDPAQPGTFVCEIDELPLVPGRYRVDVEIQGRSYLQDGIEGAAVFDVEQGTLEGRPVAGGSAGDVAVAHRWIVPSLD